MNKFDILKKYFGYDTFRAGQEELIDAMLSGKDVLGIMPTGAGKSICYQVPALLFSGITIIISPLISLMKDQVRSLNDAGIHAAYINSSLSDTQIRKAMSLAQEGRYKIIYIAPERLLSPLFLHFSHQVEISMITVDEAHCISQWGQDFRPSYRNIAQFAEQLPSRPIISAFTATATQEVRSDIVCMLGLESPTILLTGFNRENLYFDVRTGDKDTAVLSYVQSHKGMSGIIYCATRKNVEQVCESLVRRGIPATRYHAGLSPNERKANQDAFIFDEKPVMVATNAFGMGIDKSNVRYVIHYNMPQSLENYYQEAGRAGRDGEAADCILLYAPQDVHLAKFLLEKKEFPEDILPDDAAAIRDKDEERLRRMTYYGTTKDCLRGYILRYFGETAQRRCENCSNCLRNFIEEDVTDVCIDILHCIEELPRPFGAGTIAMVLRGNRSSRLDSYDFPSLSCYGLRRSTSEKKLREIMQELLEQAYITASQDQYAVLSLTDKASQILQDGKRVSMKFSPNAQTESGKKSVAYVKRRVSPKSSVSFSNQALFKKLQALRLTIAREEKIPPYIVFTDNTLQEMCRHRPTTRAAMLRISGVGETKYEKYGERFLEVLRQE